jgi:hypothetical protein
MRPFRGGFTILSSALLLKQSIVIHYLKGLKSDSLLVRSHKMDTRIYIVRAVTLYIHEDDCYIVMYSLS